jgi:hypothetical protein
LRSPLEVGTAGERVLVVEAQRAPQPGEQEPDYQAAQEA